MAYPTRISPGLAAELTVNDSSAILKPFNICCPTNTFLSSKPHTVQDSGHHYQQKPGGRLHSFECNNNKKTRASLENPEEGSRTLRSLTYKKCVTLLFSMWFVLRSRKLQPQLLWLSRSSLGGTTWKCLNSPARHPQLERGKLRWGRGPNFHNHTLSQSDKYWSKTKLIFTEIFKHSPMVSQQNDLESPFLLKINWTGLGSNVHCVYSIDDLLTPQANHINLTRYREMHFPCIGIYYSNCPGKLKACFGIRPLKFKAGLKPRSF